MYWNRCPSCCALITAAVIVICSVPHVAMAAPELVGVRHNVTPSQLLRIDTFDASLAELGLVDPWPMNGLAYDWQSGTLWGVHPFEYRLYTIDTTTGESIPVGDVGAIGVPNVNALAYNPNDRVLYTADINTDRLIEVDPLTGLGNVIAPLYGALDIEGMAYDSVNDNLYGLSDDSNRLVKIDTATGFTTTIGGSLGNERWRGLAYNSQTGLLYASTVLPGELYSIDPMTGSATFIGSLAGGDASIQGLAFIPAPASVALFSIALLARRRRDSALLRSDD